MELKQIARAFDMKIGAFAEYIGYTRQALHEKSATRSAGARKRAKAAIQLLELRSRQMLDDELREARARFDARAEAIESLEKLLGGGDTDG